MGDYVYALHDFQPENEDEVPFAAGERIEVVERDDQYGDGWWQGRNLSGRVGLFPVSYTTPAPPSAQSVPEGLNHHLEQPQPQPLPPQLHDVHEHEHEHEHDHLENGDEREETFRARTDSGARGHPALESIHEHDEPASSTASAGASLAPAAPTPPAAPMRLDSDMSLYPDSVARSGQPSPLAYSEDGRRMMSATLTDVQQAIEQLGARRAADDGGRSFSFVSSRSGVSDTEGDDDDFGTEDGADDDPGWPRDARAKLAEKARAAAEREQRAREREEARATLGPRTIAPPIEVELSDESEPEEDDTRHPAGPPGSGAEFVRNRLHSDIPEESESHASTLSIRSRSVESPEPTATATRATFTLPPPPAPVGVSIYHSPDDPRANRASQIYPAFEEEEYPPEEPEEDMQTLPTPISPVISLPSPAPPPVFVPPPAPVAAPAMPVAAPAPVAVIVQEPTPHPAALMAAHPPAQARDMGASPSSAAFPTKPASVSSIAQPMPMMAPVTPPPAGSQSPSAQSPRGGGKTHPSEWTVDEVVDWLRSKGFDQAVLDAFIEQEITGDVLLEIDAAVLKAEFGIAAFGKRTRIANAISELKRPASFSYSEPAYGYPAPIAVPPPGAGAGGALRTPASGSAGHSLRSESPARGAEHHRRNISDVSGSGASSVRWASAGDTTVDGSEGASFGSLAPLAGAKLAPSTSEGALHARAVHHAQIPEEIDEERAALSESEAAPKEKSRRRQFFGRSLDSTAEKEDVAPSPVSAKSDGARSASGAGTATETGSVRSRHSKKRSVDAGAADKKSDRLSIFGGISGSIKGRKPAPRYSAVIDNPEASPEKPHSSRLLSSLYPGSSSKRGQGQRPVSDEVSPVEHRDNAAAAAASPAKRGHESAPPAPTPALLRKRTASQNEVPVAAAPGAGPGAALKQGQSILEQIGAPDHEGWMRKKGERYNSWKVRYFVLKGPHLYCMRSNSRTETKIKGYIHIGGYKVVADETVDVGRYGFRLVHDSDKVHLFSSEEKGVIREWMKALIKATITRDYQKPVISSVNIPTIPLAVAQTMNPAPRPPSPTARDATQRATRRDNPNQLSTRDAQILMGIPGQGQPQARGLPNGFRDDQPPLSPSYSAPSPISPRLGPGGGPAPPRPSREMRRGSSVRSQAPSSAGAGVDPALIEWANSRLPLQLQIQDTSGSLCSGLALLRLAEAIKGKPASPPVPDAAFPAGPEDDKLDGLFRLFDFLLDNDVKLGTVSINDVRQGRRDKIVQILRALRAWEDGRRKIANSLGKVPTMQGGLGGPMMPPGAAWGAAAR